MRSRIFQEVFRAFAVAAFGVLRGTSAAAELSAGGYHCVRVDEGAVKGLGDGTYGQLGGNPAGAPATVAGLSDITDVEAGGFSTLALKSDGTVWFLGETTLQHTTPHGTPNPVSAPVQVPGLSGIDAIAAGHRHYLALDADTGNLYAWGHNGSGQVGNGGLLDITNPVMVLTGVASMSAGDGFSLAVKTGQTLWAWGRNSHGQLGLGDTADRLVPTQVPGVTGAASVAAGGQHSLIRLAGGTVLATGNNEFGQLGIGTNTSASTPAAIPGLSSVIEISAGYFHSAALGSDNQIRVWGRNHEGQCGGGGASPVTYTSPQVMAGLSDTPVGVACGYHFTLIKLADASIAGTGSNSDGQLDGTSVADPADSRKILAPQSIPLATDTIAPSLNSLNPPNGATGVSATTHLILTFEESVQKGSGNILIKENLGNAIFATINVADTTVNGATVTMVPPAALAAGTQYYVEIAPGGFLDLAGNPFAGIAGSKVWNFITTPTSPSASPVAHYTFDANNSGTTPDSVGSAFATLGGGVSINTTVTGRLGAGVLDMTNANGSGTASVDGAVTNNSFAWTTGDARTMTFWWKAKTPVANTQEGAFVSFGTTSANGTRFDFKEQGAPTVTATLRVEVQGAGQGTNPVNFDNGNWHFVAVTVPDNATFADISWFAGVRGGTLSSDLNTGTSTQDIATGTGPLVFGDSIISSSASDNRTPNGYLDDFQLHDEVLTTEQISFLYNNPGNVLGTPIDTFQSYISDPAFGLDPGEQGFTQDPDGDGLANGLEAWFGTHPGVSDAGLSATATDGVTTTFTHPQNENRPADVVGYYEWSPNLTDWYSGDGVDGPPGGLTIHIALLTLGSTTTVTATASQSAQRLFLRVGALRN